MTNHARELRAAAIEAHNCGATAAAEMLFRVLLETYPQSSEAAEAAHYLTKGYRQRLLLAVSAAVDATSPKKTRDVEPG